MNNIYILSKESINCFNCSNYGIFEIDEIIKIVECYKCGSIHSEAFGIRLINTAGVFIYNKTLFNNNKVINSFWNF